MSLSYVVNVTIYDSVFQTASFRHVLQPKLCTHFTLNSWVGIAQSVTIKAKWRWRTQKSCCGFREGFVSSPQRPNRTWGPHKLPLVSSGGVFSRVNEPDHETDHSSGEFRNEWSYAYTDTPVCLHGVYWDNFTCIFIYFSCPQYVPSILHLNLTRAGPNGLLGAN
jgi:hypothetical protein